jgi:hypothetical protein
MSHSELTPKEIRISTPQDQVVRAGLVVVSVGLLIIGLSFLFRADWALRLWPVKEGPLSYLFVASIILAQATALGWTAVSLELNYARGGVLGFAAMNAGFAWFAVSRYRQFPDTPLVGWMVVCGLLFLGGMALFFMGRHYPKMDRRPVPPLVSWSFLILAIPLTIATVMLLARAKVVFPWPLKPETSILFGFFYFASITYFFDGWWRPAMGNCLGQLAAFFVYDIVLIPRYLQHWPKAQGPFRISLAIYLAVLFWSAFLAIWIWGKHMSDRGRKVVA